MPVISTGFNHYMALAIQQLVKQHASIRKLYIIRDYKETSAFILEIDFCTVRCLQHLRVKIKIDMYITVYVFVCVHIYFSLCVFYRNHIHRYVPV